MNNILHEIHKSVLALSLAVVAAVVAAPSAHALVTSYYATESVLSQGGAVKVHVTNTGVHSITYEQLRQWGFDDPSHVAVYGANVLQLNDHLFASSYPDDLPMVPAVNDATNERLFFYAVGDHRVLPSSDTTCNYDYKNQNPYSIGSYYFLVDNGAPLPEMGSYAVQTTGTRTTRLYHTHVEYVENNVWYPRSSTIYTYDRQLAADQSVTYDFTLDNYYSAVTDKTYLRYGVAGCSYSAEHGFTAVATDNLAATRTYDVTLKRSGVDSGELYSSYTVGSGYIMGDLDPEATDNKVSVTFTYYGGSWGAVDYATFIFPRYNTLEGGAAQQTMPFCGVTSTSAGIDAKLAGGSANVMVWDVSNPNNIREHKTQVNAATGEVKFSLSKRATADGVGVYVAFDRTRDQYPVEYAGAVQPQNLHATETPDMLIVVGNPDLLPQAQALAEIHRTRLGHDVVVAMQDQILNEFSYGTKHPMGIRRFAKMLYDRNPDKFAHILMYGTGSFDNSGRLEGTTDNLLLTYQIHDQDAARDSGTDLTSDSYFAMLRDNFVLENYYKTLLTVNVSRLPIKTVSQAQAYNQKVTDYLQNPPKADDYLNALICAGDGDDYGHLAQALKMTTTLLKDRPETTVARQYYDFTKKLGESYAQKSTLARLGARQSLMSYNGHGGSVGNIFYYHSNAETSHHVPGMMYLLASCDAFAFDRMANTTGTSIVEYSTLKRDGGFMAMIGASRSAYMDFNIILANRIVDAWAKTTSTSYLGDIFRNGRNAAITDSTTKEPCLNSMSYNMAGDPALPIYAPDHKVVVTRINGIDISDGDTGTVVLQQLQPVTVEGYIATTDGTTLDDFNGSITLTVYDGPEHLNITTSAGKVVADFDKEDMVLGKYGAEVHNGQFTASFITPRATLYGDRNRLTLGADHADDLYTKAIGITNAICITADLADMDETQYPAPTIDEMYLDSPDFQNGDAVGQTAVLYATISASALGLNLSTNQVGGTRLMLDGNTPFKQARSSIKTDGDGLYTMTFNIGGLTAGQHYLMLVVADNAGNTAEREITFTVGDALDMTPLDGIIATDIETANRAVRAPLEISVVVPAQDVELAGRLVIEDVNGTCVATATASQLPYVWDLNDLEGTPVANGSYRAIPKFAGADGRIVNIEPLQFNVIQPLQ